MTLFHNKADLSQLKGLEPNSYKQSRISSRESVTNCSAVNPAPDPEAITASHVSLKLFSSTV